ENQAEWGWIGALHPEVLENYKLKDGVVAAELQLDQLFPFWVQKPSLKKHSRYPSVIRDLALAVPEQTQAGDIMRAIYAAGSELVTQVTPFDLYQGEHLPPGTKSLAFSLTLQALDRTLHDEEVNRLQTKIVAHLEKTFHALQR
ncbi:phenylalanine--tRNA ligase subunit beta, partial [candidate division FCPU426 bacterium]|nr:phenylalanine--tRNA ligase subunit beta [candidate division FCPU426 bacterium]